jgi:hypothetical protein
MPVTYQPIATQTLGSATNLVTFSSIPSTYTDLVFVFNGSNATSNNGLRLRFNSDSGTNYSTTYFYGNGSSVASTFGSNTTGGQIATDIASGQSTCVTHIMNYSNTTTFKVFLGRGSSASTYADHNVSLWRNTAAVTSVTVLLGAGTSNFSTGSTFTLYGIKAA